MTLHLISLLLALLGTTSQPPRVNPIVGTWTLAVVSSVRADGSRVHPYGDDPQGILMFDANGRYSLQIMRAGRPKFASNDRLTGTADENKAAVQGCNTHFGRYVVDAANGTIMFRIEHASFPNWEGTEQKRSFTLNGNELKYIVPTPSTGGAVTGEVVWRRAE